MRIIHRPSPNFNDRRAPVDMLVLHYTGMASGEAAEARLCDPAAEVSAHYVVREDGVIVALVGEDKRAWHAGRGSWQGREDINSRSIGIEIVNGGHDFPRPDGSLPPYPHVQITAVISLCRAILARHAIPQAGIVGHSDIAPMRKADPGEHFPWLTLANAGFGLWPSWEPAGPKAAGPGLAPGDSGKSVGRLQEHLAAIGYALPASGIYDEHTEAVVRAFQRRWNPAGVTGAADLGTLAMIGSVATLYSAASGK